MYIITDAWVNIPSSGGGDTHSLPICFFIRHASLFFFKHAGLAQTFVTTNNYKISTFTLTLFHTASENPYHSRGGASEAPPLVSREPLLIE